jgi:hypothetical protein
MRAHSAALGIAAVAALSSAASALPCAETALGKTETSEITCTVSGKTSNPLARDEQGEPLADAAQRHLQPAVDQSPLSLDFIEAADGENTEAADGENFARRDIKITNLQATMTSNKYIAGRLPAAGETTPVDDLISLSPDYLSTKMLPNIPKRKPVGVGLVTVPKPPVKESDTNPPGQWFPQPGR